ncbi:melanoma cell adhesion molecule b isoform X2 [Lampris incognitus]|uniref:melanoma cell adhesion molecule b isoform X2 n=1 Tax=Lampris incognitus TaxID=2546036 RepID=UPI0024B49BC3|nr:melanoma cell adhesion molecule b isoform X2 [Lampris incognitus]
MASQGNGFGLLVGLLLAAHIWRAALANLEVNMEDRVEVFRGEMASITCMFKSSDGIGGVRIQWSYMTRTGAKERIYYQDTTMKFVDKGTPFTGRISVNGTAATGELVLTIQDVRIEDELDFICTIMGLTDGSSEGRTQLRVFAAPELPLIEGVHTGISVNSNIPSKIGSCEAKNGFPRPNITWYRNTTPLYNIIDEVTVQSLITQESSGLFSVKSELSMKVVEEDKDSVFYCEVNYFVPGGTLMTETSRINISVYYPTTALNVWVESPKGDIKEGDTVELQCRGNGNPEPTFTFQHKDTAIESDSNVLLLKNVTRSNSGTYYCTAFDLETYEEVTGNTTVFVNYLDSAVVSPRDIVISQGEEVKATCNALSSLEMHTVWFKNKKEVAKGHILTLGDAVLDTAGTYVCVVTIPKIKGMKTSATLRVLVKSPPQISKPGNLVFEESIETTVNLSCHARGIPAPNITWTSSDSQILKTVSQKMTEDGTHSVVSVKVTSDITAFCNASNDYGVDVVTFSIKAIPHTTMSTTTTTTTTTITTATTEGSGVIIAVVIICILLLAILGSVLYFLYKKGKICGRSGKQDLTKEKSNKENIVVEMKSDNTEDAVLLGVNGDKKAPNEQ